MESPSDVSEARGVAGGCLADAPLDPEGLLRLVNRLVVRLAARRDLGEMLETILDALLHVWPIDACGIYTLEPETGDMRLVMHRGLQPRFIERSSHYRADSLNVRLVRRGDPVYVGYSQLLALLGKSGPDDEGLRGVGVIPILHEGQAIGAMNVASHGFEEIPLETRASLEAIAAHVAGALARVTAERAAERERKNLATFFSTTQDLLFVVDRGLRLVHCNEAMTARLGYADRSLIGMPIRELYAPGDGESVGRLMEGVFQARTGIFSLPWRSSQGEVIPVETRVVLGSWEGRDALFGVSRDMTERNRLESLLRHNQKMDALGNLAGGIAHDFKNVLAGIMACAEAALCALEAHEDVHDDLKAILETAERGDELARRLMAFARKSEVRFEPVDVEREVQGVVDLLRRTLPGAIRVRFEGECHGARVQVDRGGLSAALLNLATNARDAMPGGGALGFSVEQRRWEGGEPEGPYRAGPYVRISVSDTGTGMDERTQARIFEPFFSTKEPGRGTGLGLAMVYTMVRDAGGEIRCLSVPGQGTTFTMFLPLAPGAPAAEAQGRPHSGASAS